MYNKIVDGISVKLNEVFGDEYKIYTESVKQGLDEPCFFIQLVNPGNRRILGKRYFRENLFCIQYFPANADEPKAECYEMQDALFLALEYITVDGDLQRGSKMHGKLTDGVLSFFVNYDMFLISYVNFISLSRATATLADRGIATIPYALDWGVQGEIAEVSTADFQKNSLKLFGYDYTAPQLKGLRDFFKNIRLAYLFRLGTGGTKAANEYATAKYAGSRGNALKVVIATNVDDTDLFDVYVYLDTILIDKQTAKNAGGLANNDFVDWKADATLAVTAGTPLTGGESPVLTNADYQAYLDLVEGFSFNAIGCPSDDTAIKGMFAAFTKRLRDEQGVKFQCVLHDYAADYEGVVNVKNAAVDEGGNVYDAVYWTTGTVAGTAVNKSALNMVYNGEFQLETGFTQSQLEGAIANGEFTFHRVGNEIRVLADINSLVNVTVEKGEDFKQNQTIRVIDQIANDIAVMFNTKYLGVVPNDADGRISLWSDIVRHHEQLQTIRAIEDFKGDDVQVSQGDTKRSVVVSDKVTPVNAMAQLYMTCVIA